jgi:hypothetical protein
VVLSKRERYIAVLTGVVLAALVLYQFVLQPLSEQSDTLDMNVATASADFMRLNKVVKQSKEATKELRAMTDVKNGGKLSADASAAETLLYRSVRDWAQEAGMSPPSVQPTRTAEKEKDFFKLTFRVQGGGSMSQISRFLYRIKTTSVPVQINELQITSNKENTDDLKLSLTLSTIYLAPETDKQAKPGATVARAGEVGQ